MELEQSQNFNERLSQWVANQGFWFQIRYSMTGTGTAGTAMFHLLRLGARLLVFLLIVAVGGWIYLWKMTESKKFSNGIQEQLKTGLFASKAEMKKFSRTKGELSISRLICKGEKETFFTSLEARGIRCKMGLLAGIYGVWDTGTITISRLDMELRAGADDAESAQMLAKALFHLPSEVIADSIEVADASLQWGYSERTRGSIENSTLKIQRQGKGWKLSFSGGKFSQNWLRRLEITELVILCDAEGIVFEKAELRDGEGTVDFSGLKVVGGERPIISGLAKVRKVGMPVILPEAMTHFVDGSLSGDFKVSGSTNSAEGVGLEGLVTLDGEDMLTLRDRIHLLKALSGVDYVRNYHRLDFTEGSLHLKTTAGGLTLTDVSLKAGDLFTLAGNLQVRLPTAEETKAALAESATADDAAALDNGETRAGKSGGEEFTLRQAAKELKAARDGALKPKQSTMAGQLGSSVDARQLEVQASERLSKMLRYEGMFEVSIPGDAFETAPRLREHYPVNPETGRIPLRVPIQGGLYEITLEQGESIYQLRSGGSQ